MHVPLRMLSIGEGISLEIPCAQITVKVVPPGGHHGFEIVVQVFADQHGSVSGLLHPDRQIVVGISMLVIKAKAAFAVVRISVGRVVDFDPRIVSVLRSVKAGPLTISSLNTTWPCRGSSSIYRKAMW